MRLVDVVLLIMSSIAAATEVVLSAGGATQPSSDTCWCLNHCALGFSGEVFDTNCLATACGIKGELSSLGALRSSCRTMHLVRRHTMHARKADEQGASLMRTARDLSAKENSATPIPKIVHFMYKDNLLNVNRSTWPNPVWRFAFEAWQKHFNEIEYKYVFWDEHAIDQQFKKHCSAHVKLYGSFENNISRSDLARYCILHEQGGIYADLDYEPRENFYDSLHPGKVNLIESPYEGENLQNSLMASPPGHSFWTHLLAVAGPRAHKLNPDQLQNPTIATGPILLDTLSFQSGKWDDPKSWEPASLSWADAKFWKARLRSDVNKLPCKEFQHRMHKPRTQHNDKPGCGFLTYYEVDHVKGIHWGTQSWFDVGKGEVENSDMRELFSRMHGVKYTVPNHPQSWWLPRLLHWMLR